MMQSSSDMTILTGTFERAAEIVRTMTLLIKAIVILFLGAIFFSLGSALYYLVRDHGDTSRIVKALTWRIALSCLLFFFLLFFFGMGWITPHSLLR